MTEKFISVSDFVDYLGTLPKDVRGYIFNYLRTRDLCRVIEVHTNMLAKENEELAQKIQETGDSPSKTGSGNG